MTSLLPAGGAASRPVRWVVVLSLAFPPPAPAQEGAVGFNRYATVEAKIVGLQDGDRWICPVEAVGICDLERGAPPPGADLVGSVSNLSYDRDGFGHGRLGEIRVDIEQPSIFDPFSVTRRITRWEFKPSRWKEYLLSSLREGFRTDELRVNDSTTVEATLWFLRLPIQVQLGWREDPGFFGRNELAGSYGRVRVLIRLEPETDRSVYLRRAGRDPGRFRLSNLYMGPHAVEAAAVSHWGRLGPDRAGTTGLRWNAGGERVLAHDPESAWRYPLASEERERILGVGDPATGYDPLPGPGRERSWFNRPVYFTVDLTRLEGSRQEVTLPDGGTERRWVGDQVYVDAAIHTYVVGEWTNRPVDVAEGSSAGPVQADARDWRSLLARLVGWIPGRLEAALTWAVLGAAGFVVVLALLPGAGYGLGAGIRSFVRGLKGL